ncbi:hypothetical protein BDR26DRAFT_850903 [Obelidium mucronatum]|nr:hypothetical protein BDR26DRAFT_850903 [Obelidium mucronatum]
MNLAEYENIPNIPGSEVPDSNVTISPTISAAVPTNGGSAVNNPSEGGSPSMSPGNIVLIVVAVFVGVGVIVFGAIAQYTRRKQKPVTAVEDDSYYDDPEDVEENIIYEGRASGGGRASGEFTYGSLGSGKPASIPSAQRSSYDARRSHESVTRGRKSGDTWMTAKT